ncbi:hypothetical protein BU25DRAFT_302647, partial [Macroventuria anomochaeta]
MDPASRALAQALPAGVADTYANRSEYGNAPLSTSQQYLTRDEEKALVRFLLLKSSLGQPVRIKFVRSLAFSIARQRLPTNRPSKPPGKNWPRAFEKRNTQLQAKKVRSIDWKRHGNNIHEKV